MTPAANTKSSAIPVSAVKPASKGLSRNAIIGIITAVAVVIGAGFGFRQWQFYVTHEETDDAQIEGHISPVLPRVSGYVSQVLVNDNQHVAAGQPLVEIDAQELDLKVSAADASEHNAVAELRTSEASLESAKAAALTAAANVETALVRQKKAAHDLERDTKLFATGAITDSQLSDTQAAADTASATYQAVSSQVKTAEADVEVPRPRLRRPRRAPRS